jgi:hypothetical protein
MNFSPGGIAEGDDGIGGGIGIGGLAGIGAIVVEDAGMDDLGIIGAGEAFGATSAAIDAFAFS